MIRLVTWWESFLDWWRSGPTCKHGPWVVDGPLLLNGYFRRCIECGERSFRPAHLTPSQE